WHLRVVRGTLPVNVAREQNALIANLHTHDKRWTGVANVTAIEHDDVNLGDRFGSETLIRPARACFSAMHDGVDAQLPHQADISPGGLAKCRWSPELARPPAVDLPSERAMVVHIGRGHDDDANIRRDVGMRANVTQQTRRIGAAVDQDAFSVHG